MILKLADSDKLNLALKMFDTLVNQVFNLIGAFEGYTGGEFCSGLLFG